MSTICIPIEVILREMLESWDRDRYTLPLDMKVADLLVLFEEWYDVKLEGLRLQALPGRGEDEEDGEIC